MFVSRIICSQDGKLNYGYASTLGKRSSMEDYYEAKLDNVNGQIVGLFGVFDGGHLFSLFVSIFFGVVSLLHMIIMLHFVPSSERS